MIDNIEKIGVYWLKEEITSKDNTIYAWWGICKKTRKVAFMRVITSSIYEILPFIMNDILVSENLGCDDGKYCLNLNCPNSKNNKLIDSIKTQQPKLIEIIKDDNRLEDYFNRSMEFIHNDFLNDLSIEQLNKIFVENYKECTFNENAFVTTLKE